MPTPSIDKLKNVSGIGPAAIEKFREAGYETLADVTDATIDEITAVPGIGEATAQAIIEYVAEEMGAATAEEKDSDAAPDEDAPAAEADADGGEDAEAEDQPTAEVASTDEEEEHADTDEAPATGPAPASENGDVTTPSAQSHGELLQHLSEELSEEHMQLLRVFQDPQQWAQIHEQEYPQAPFLALSTVLEHAVPEWRERQAQYDQLWRDLYRHNLVTTESLHVMTSRAGAISARTSERGENLLAFIDSD